MPPEEKVMPGGRHEGTMLRVTFPGGVAVDATVHGHTIHTDQPPASGGGDSGPAPFDLFLASIATCAGFYALRFCQERRLPTDGLALALTPVRDESQRLSLVRLDLTLPDAFPEKYRDALVRAVDHCAVKRAILDPPTFEVRLKGDTAVEKDPVCGMTIDPTKASGSSQYGGKTYFFCAPECKKEFDADPAKYAR